ncbi:putative capsid assembly protein [Mesorhizobium phage vB_MloP_Lo5R7ANS]|uniref:Putative capsid assembly protein n=1 Tax=Mesorhizobium phage vB_MloP_Lo5R7ANS TaxID=1527771 RepID=A0A076YJ53_9CAUD|nr:head assembly [Mesorhizobium phage vB_MloP_Lo5R7ANS]AIK68513.1 putative capsid assembly protein [Mesorhizobium phage vB_MloP_Lo5R7ANS]
MATQRITSAAGGKESMDRMFAWASTSIPAAEIDTFNKAFEGADVNAAVIAMEQLKAKYETANGKDPTLIGGKPSGSSVDAYGSWAEVTHDMSDERYGKDPAFRAKVQAKLGRSNI